MGYAEKARLPSRNQALVVRLRLRFPMFRGDRSVGPRTCRVTRPAAAADGGIVAKNTGPQAESKSSSVVNETGRKLRTVGSGGGRPQCRGETSSPWGKCTDAWIRQIVAARAGGVQTSADAISRIKRDSVRAVRGDSQALNRRRSGAGAVRISKSASRLVERPPGECQHWKRVQVGGHPRPARASVRPSAGDSRAAERGERARPDYGRPGSPFGVHQRQRPGRSTGQAADCAVS